jgi:hypothetical protein
MKVISWNLRNIGQTKLGNPFTAAVAGKGLGNNVRDYIINLVMGNAVWNNIATGNPADVFVVIELKSGGHNKGNAAFGTAGPTLASILGAMNLVVANTVALQGQYAYAAVPPLIVGYHEAVGIIYNTHRLNFGGAAVLRDVNNRYINPRTPFAALFNIIGTATNLTVVGIHAPPPSGGAAVRYRPPINWLNLAATVPSLPNTWQFVSGDYNCDPTSTYTNGFGAVVGWAFANYGTHIPANTLSSVRQKVANANPAPANYLSDAYDNLLFNFNPGVPVHQSVLDLIGNARDFSGGGAPVAMYPGSLVALLNNYNKVSDHMPTVLEF